MTARAPGHFGSSRGARGSGIFLFPLLSALPLAPLGRDVSSAVRLAELLREIQQGGLGQNGELLRRQGLSGLR